MTNTFKRNGLIAAGIMNIVGVLLFSRAFTNEIINIADQIVMSNFGLVMIIVWGLAYISAATIESSIKWLVAVFAIEKFIYILIWIRWLYENDIALVYSDDLFAGVFYSIYGLNDIVFMLFFIWVFISESKTRNV